MTKLSTPYPPLSSPSPTWQVKWPVSKEKKSMKYPKATYAELVFPCKCFENWDKEEKESQINTTLSDQDLVIAIAVKNKHTQNNIKKKRERKTKQNKTKQRTTQMESGARHTM